MKLAPTAIIAAFVAIVVATSPADSRPDTVYQEAVLFASDAADQSFQGQSGGGFATRFGQHVAVAANGTVATSAPEADSGHGAIYVYQPLPDGSYDETKLSFGNSPLSDRIHTTIGLSDSGTVLFFDRYYDRQNGQTGAIGIAQPSGDGYHQQVLAPGTVGLNGWVFRWFPVISPDGTVAATMSRGNHPNREYAVQFFRPDSGGAYVLSQTIETDFEFMPIRMRGNLVIGHDGWVVDLDQTANPLTRLTSPVPAQRLLLNDVDGAGNIYARVGKEIYVYKAQSPLSVPTALNIADFGVTGYPQVSVSESGRLAVRTGSLAEVLVLVRSSTGYVPGQLYRSRAELSGSRRMYDFAFADETVVMGLDLGAPDAWGSGALTTFRTQEGGGVVPGPVTSCTASRDGAKVHITWSGAETADSFVIYRSTGPGSTFWRGRTKDALGFVDTDHNGSLTYSVVAINDFQRQTPTTCNTQSLPSAAPISSCSFSRTATHFMVSWRGGHDSDAVVVQRSVDGSPWYWRGSVDPSQAAFVDPARGTDVRYRVISKKDTLFSAAVNCDATP